MDARTTRNETAAGRSTRTASTVVGICSDALGDPVGAVLHGSLVLGDYISHRSDIDLLVFVDRPPRDDEVSDLLGNLVGERLATRSPVDLRIVTLRTAAFPTRAPFMELYVRLPEPGPDSIAEVEMRGAERDLIVEFSVCRAHGISLVGPKPMSMIGEVPDRWVVEVGDAQLADWLRLEFEPRYAELMVLTACRVWRFAEEGRHSSKTAAAEWALSANPSFTVIRSAIDRRRDDAGAAIDEHRVRDLLAHVRQRTVELARGSSVGQVPDQRER